MKKIIVTAALLCAAVLVLAGAGNGAFAQWKPAGEKIKTLWAETLNPSNVLPEYPRPIMERDDWANLKLTKVGGFREQTREGYRDKDGKKQGACGRWQSATRLWE
jgi:hypothetical protein